MPFNSRDVWVVLKAQDMATRALNSYSRAVRKAGLDTQLAQAMASRGANVSALAQNQLAVANQRAAVASLTNEKSTIRNTLAQQQLGLALQQAQAQRVVYQKSLLTNEIAQRKLNGTTAEQIIPLQNAKLALDRELIARRQVMLATKAHMDMTRAASVAIDGQIAAQRRGIIATQQQGNALRANISAWDSTISRIRQHADEVAKHEETMKRLSNSLRAGAQTAFAMGFAVTAVGVGGVLAMKNLVDAAMEYDRTVRLTATQVQQFSGNFKELGDIGLEVANSIGVKFEEIQPALYDLFSSMDISIQDARKDLILFSKAAVAGQTSISNVSRGTIGILNAFHLKAQDLNKVLDMQFRFIQKGTGTYDDWIQKIGLVSPSAIRAGQGLDTMLGALAAASRMGMNAASSAAAVSRSMDALSNPAAIEKLKALGVKVTDVHGNFRSMVDILKDFRDVLAKMPGGQEKKIAAILDVFKGAGGTQQARRFLQNMLLQPGDLEQFESIVAAIKDSAGSLDTAYGQMSNSVAAKTQLLRNKWETLKIGLGEALTPAFLKLVDIISKAVDAFNRLDPKTKNIIASIFALATVVGLVVGPLFLVFSAVAALAAALTVASPEILAVVGVLLAFGAAVSIGVISIGKFISGFEPLQNLLKNVGQWFSYLKDNIILPFVRDIRQAFYDHLYPSFIKIKDAISDHVIPAMNDFLSMWKTRVEPVLRSITEFMRDRVEGVFKRIAWMIDHWVVPAVHKLTKAYYDHREEIDRVLALLLQFAGMIAKVMGYIGQWIVILGIGGLVGALSLLLNTIGFIIGAIGDLVDAMRNVDNIFKIAIEGIKLLGLWLQLSLLQAIQTVISRIPGLGALNSAIDDIVISTRSQIQATGENIQKYWAEMDAEGKATTSTTTLSGKIKDTTSAIRDNARAADDLYSSYMNLDMQQAGLQEAFATFQDVLRNNGKALDNTSAAGARNKLAILGMIEKAQQYRQTLIDQKVPIDEANRRYQQMIDKIHDQAAAVLGDSSALDTLMQKYRDLYKAPDIVKRVTIHYVQEGTDTYYGGRTRTPNFASGGRIAAGRIGIVGENEPELFIPNVSGYILPFSRMAELFQQVAKVRGSRWTHVPRGQNATLPQEMYTPPTYRQSGTSGPTITVNVVTQELRPEYHAAQLGVLLAGRI